MGTLSRRGFLRRAVIVSGAAALAACSPQPTATPPPAQPAQPASAPTATTAAEVSPTAVPAPKVEGTVTVMHKRSELTEDQQAQFEADYPGIKISLVEDDADRLTAMLAAGTAPDLWRTNFGNFVGVLVRKLVRDLTPYFEVSEVIKLDDLAPANKAYWAEDALHIGSGKIYGMVKDWSPGLTLFINTGIFEQAGVQAPGDADPLTYDTIYALAQELTKREGDRILVWGYGGAAVDWNIDGCVVSHLAETAGVTPNPYVGVLYNDIFNRINITGNEEAKRAFKYYYDMAAENLIANPLNPSSNWTGQDFADGKVAIVQEGYWFSAMAESDNTRGKVKPLPSPRWSTQGKRLNCPTATGMVVSAATKLPDVAWKVFEWYMGKEPAIDRAKSGWGVPGLKSLYNLMPQESDFQKQCYKVLIDEAANADCESQWPVDPWGGLWFLPIWNKHIEPALRKQITLDEALKNVEDEVNTTLGEQFKRYS